MLMVWLGGHWGWWAERLSVALGSWRSDSQIRHVLGKMRAWKLKGAGGESGGVASFEERVGNQAESRLKKMGFMELLEVGIKSVATALESGGQNLEKKVFLCKGMGSWLDSALAC